MCAAQGSFELVREMGTVWQAGERIEIGQAVNVLLGRFALGNVPGDDQHLAVAERSAA
jgi:hypothetical protein